ncbi:MAG: histidine--tRNA ligase [Myxococcota bacterium]|nr:histidine--tRNA ligase [Myxococcota bacterium]
MTTLRAVKGMNDVLPDEIDVWHRVERLYARTMELHGFREVRTPCVEPTSLFVRAIGEVTDVVEKEMYSFEHRGEPLTLRPEGTAGAARAYIEHAVSTKESASRWWYAGPMFRAERPQRGRYRQFYQLGAEVFGEEAPGSDAAMIDMLFGFLSQLGILDLEVVINSIGGQDARTLYRDAVVRHLTPKAGELSPESQRRLTTNPLRILDSKDDRDRKAIEDGPNIHDVLGEEDREHFSRLRAHLDALGTPYSVEPRLVRGLDYYTRTLFEVRGASEKLGSGSTLAGGGRYDSLVADLGGPRVPAVGFAIGLERLLIASSLELRASVVDVLIAPLGQAAISAALVLARPLRSGGIRCEVDTRGTSLKSQLRRANALGASIVVILGDAELAEGVVQVKDLAAHTQERMTAEEAVRVVVGRLTGPAATVGPRGIQGEPQTHSEKS